MLNEVTKSAGSAAYVENRIPVMRLVAGDCSQRRGCNVLRKRNDAVCDWSVCDCEYCVACSEVFEHWKCVRAGLCEVG